MAQATYETIRNKARYGHKSYVVWTDRDGTLQYGIYNKATLKRAILAVGTQGRFSWLSASTGVGNLARSFSYMLHLLKCAPAA